MNTFFKSCRRCLNPWVIALILIAIGALIYFVPIIGIGTLIAVLPLLGCTLMCGVMAFMMKGHKDKEKE